MLEDHIQNEPLEKISKLFWGSNNFVFNCTVMILAALLTLASV